MLVEVIENQQEAGSNCCKSSLDVAEPLRNVDDVLKSIHVLAVQTNSDSAILRSRRPIMSKA